MSCFLFLDEFCRSRKMFYSLKIVRCSLVFLSIKRYLCLHYLLIVSTRFPQNTLEAHEEAEPENKNPSKKINGCEFYTTLFIECLLRQTSTEIISRVHLRILVFFLIGRVRKQTNRFAPKVSCLSNLHNKFYQIVLEIL